MMRRIKEVVASNIYEYLVPDGELNYKLRHCLQLCDF